MPMFITDSLSIALMGLQPLFRETTKSSFEESTLHEETPF